jgi:hypothetical protein
VAGAREHLKTAGLPDEVVAIPLAAVEDQGQQQQQPADGPHVRGFDQERTMGFLRELLSLAADLRAKTTVA